MNPCSLLQQVQELLLCEFKDQLLKNLFRLTQISEMIKILELQILFCEENDFKSFLFTITDKKISKHSLSLCFDENPRKLKAMKLYEQAFDEVVSLQDKESTLHEQDTTTKGMGLFVLDIKTSSASTKHVVYEWVWIEK